MSDAEIFRKLWGFVVPSDKPEFRSRVAVSMAFLVASKGLTIVVSLRNSVTTKLETLCHVNLRFSSKFADYALEENA